MATKTLREIAGEIRNFARLAADLGALQQFSVDLLAERLNNYNWVGFYMIDPTDENTLVLGPFHGASTEHVRIPLARGICGAAVAQGETIIVDDVSLDPRYLSCSIETRSEIVVPIRVYGKVVGEIDVDSHAPSSFGDEDREFLEECATVIGEFLERKPG
jgi:L-methionine (R)-S-oxide reductase